MNKTNFNEVEEVRKKLQSEVMNHANMISISEDSDGYYIHVGFETEEDQENCPYKDGIIIDGVKLKTTIIGMIIPLASCGLVSK
jgi:hypothetical protein